MAKRYKHTLMRKMFGRMVERNVRKGKGVPGWHILTTKGRTSGLPRRVPVTLIEREGSRYLVAGYGIVNWVHNVRANPEVTVERAGAVDSVVATELIAEEAAPVLDEYYSLLSKYIAPYWDVPRDGATPEDFVAAVATHPAFRLDAAG